MKAAIKARQKRNTVRAEAYSTNSYDKEGKVLVAFGPNNHMTRQALFESVQDEQKKYIRELLHHPISHPGGKLDQLQCYLRKKQEQERADDEILVQLVEEIEHRETGKRYCTYNYNGSQCPWYPRLGLSSFMLAYTVI